MYHSILRNLTNNLTKVVHKFKNNNYIKHFTLQRFQKNTTKYELYIIYAIFFNDFNFQFEFKTFI